MNSVIALTTAELRETNCEIKQITYDSYYICRASWEHHYWLKPL